MVKKIIGLLLSAGSSQRFGSNKLLHPLLEGVPIAAISARNLKTVVADCIALIPENDNQLQQLYQREGLDVVANQNAKNGMSSSIVCGVKASSNADGWVIALADMPFVAHTDIQRVVAELQAGATLVAPYCGAERSAHVEARRGHPVGFSRHFFKELTSLKGDAGAANILHRYANQLVSFESQDDGVIRDIDDRDELKLVIARRGNRQVVI